jgi:hypothetical protein
MILFGKTSVILNFSAILNFEEIFFFQKMDSKRNLINTKEVEQKY